MSTKLSETLETKKKKAITPIKFTIGNDLIRKLVKAVLKSILKLIFTKKLQTNSDLMDTKRKLQSS